MLKRAYREILHTMSHVQARRENPMLKKWCKIQLHYFFQVKIAQSFAYEWGKNHGN